MKLFSIVAVLAAMPVPALANDADANAVYTRMAASYAALDPAGLESVYAPDARYNSRNSRLGTHDRAQVLKGGAGFQQMVRDKGGNIDIRFRLIARQRFGDVYVDHGYVRTTYKMTSDGTATVSNGKFMTVLAKQPDGRWAITGDADADTPADSFDKAVRIDGLKYDD